MINEPEVFLPGCETNVLVTWRKVKREGGEITERCGRCELICVSSLSILG
jgi:hypothetical protein